MRARGGLEFVAEDGRMSQRHSCVVSGVSPFCATNPDSWPGAQRRDTLAAILPDLFTIEKLKKRNDHESTRDASDERGGGPGVGFSFRSGGPRRRGQTAN